MGKRVGEIPVQKDQLILIGSRKSQPNGPAFPAVFMEAHDTRALEPPQAASERLRGAIGGSVIHDKDTEVAVAGQKRAQLFANPANRAGLVVRGQDQKNGGSFAFAAGSHLWKLKN